MFVVAIGWQSGGWNDSSFDLVAYCHHRVGTNVLKGDISVAVLIVVSLTYRVPATLGRTMLDSLKIHDPVTQGLTVGGASQGLGMTSMLPEALCGHFRDFYGHSPSLC